MRIASIDIGTNTILMLIADVSADGGLRVISDEQVIARIGKGVDRNGVIEWDAFTRGEQHLSTYLGEAGRHEVDVIRCTGTSALRDARNGQDFRDYLFQNLGLDIEILSGTEEALWTYGGAITGFTRRDEAYAVLDIGGGSTELTIGKGFHVHHRHSEDIGCVRLTEKYLHHTPPRDAEVDAMLATIDTAIPRFPQFDPEATTFVGVAGTVTTLAAVELGLEVFDGNRVANFILTREMIQHRFDEFRTMTKEALQHTMRIDPGRADIILVGIAILKRLTEQRGIQQVVVSERGLRYGIVMREWERGLERADIS